MLLKKSLFFILILFLQLDAKDLIKPIPLSIEYDKQKAILGKKLFFDTKLSKNNTISCASCHLLEDGGDDNLPVSFGIDGKAGKINSPTVYNAVFNFRQFWNGRAKNLEEQAYGPITNRIEMGHNFQELVTDLKKDNRYQKEFGAIYKDGITKKNIANAIAEYEKTLITPNAPFDKYLRGDQNAITPKQKNGYRLFIQKGCIACHNGINLGGNLYSKVGIVNPLEFEDKGLYTITKDKKDMFLFRVPPLRNVALTAPYLHDGSVASLHDTVKKIGYVQLGLELKEKDIDDIVSFLDTLTGEVNEDLK